MHATITKHMSEKLEVMVPTPLQNRSWRGSGGHLGATLETGCFQDLMFDDLGAILGPPLGPIWAHVGNVLIQNETQKGANTQT